MSNQFGVAGTRTRQSRGKTETRSTLPRVLIVCEGAKTEPEYFKLFRPRITVRELDIRGEGRNTLSLIEEAEGIEKREGVFDEVWCVFDRDSFPPDNYDNAITKIQTKKRYNVAYSNEAFELWFLLHFEYLNTAIGREQYQKKLSVILKRTYLKNDANIYRQIQRDGDEGNAMERADKLLKEHSLETPMSRRCPSTTVHILIRKLREWERKSKPR